MSKLLERAVHTQLRDHLEDNFLLSTHSSVTIKEDLPSLQPHYLQTALGNRSTKGI